MKLFAGSAYDPTAADGMVAWQRPAGVALLRRDGDDRTLPGTHPALGGGRIAWREGDAVVVADAGSLGRRERRAAPGAGVLAVSESLLAWRARDALGTDRIFVAADREEPRLLLESPAPQELGRPALREGRLLCHVAGPDGSRLFSVDVASGERSTLRKERGAMLSNPSTDGSGCSTCTRPAAPSSCASARWRRATRRRRRPARPRLARPARPRGRARAAPPPPGAAAAGQAAAARRARRRRHALEHGADALHRVLHAAARAARRTAER